MRSLILPLGLFTICICLWMNAFAQRFSFSEFENEKDSLRRIELGIEGASFYRKNNLDSLKVLSVELSSKSDENEVTSENALSNRYLGTYTIRTNDITKGISLLKKARDMFTSLKMNVLLSETENELGNAYFLQGNYNQASRHYLASIVQGTNTADVTARYNGMIGFGKTVCAVGDTATGLLFVQEYLERCLRDEKFEAASDACGFLGMIAGLNGRIELMSAYYSRSVRYASRSDSKTHKANAYTNRAIDYFYHDKVDSAIYYFEQSLVIRQEVGATRPIVESLYNLGLLNIEMKNLDQAKIQLQKAELLADNGGIRSWQLDCLVLLMEIAEERKDKEEIRKIQLDMDRIRNELKHLGKLDDKIINSAIAISALDDPPVQSSFFAELIAMLAMLLCCALILYIERPSSISVGTPA